MSASITSGTYGRQQSGFAFTGALRNLFAGMFASAGTAPVRFADSSPVRVREANDVRELARSVESHSPGFAADLYAAALRHEGLDD